MATEKHKVEIDVEVKGAEKAKSQLESLRSGGQTNRARLVDPSKRPHVGSGLNNPNAPWIRTPEQQQLAWMYSKGLSSWTPIGRTNWIAKRTALRSQFKVFRQQELAGGNVLAARYYGYRAGGYTRAQANDLVSAYAHRLADRDQERRNRLSIAEQRREERSLSARARVRSNKDKLMRVRTLRAQGRMREADELLYRGEGYGSTSSDLVNALDQERQRKAQEREQRQQERQARRMQRIAERNQRQAERDEARRRRDAERAYQQQNRDENFDARQQALDARDAERAQNRANRERAKEERKRIIEEAKRKRDSASRERKSEKLSNRAHKDTVSNTKAIVGLTKGLSGLRALGLGGSVVASAASAVGGIGSNTTNVFSELQKGSNFASVNGISPADAKSMEIVADKYGVDKKELQGVLGGISRSQSMAKVKPTQEYRNANYWGVEVERNGKMLNASTVVRNWANRYKIANEEERRQILSMQGWTDDFGKFLENFNEVASTNVRGIDEEYGGVSRSALNKLAKSRYLNYANKGVEEASKKLTREGHNVFGTVLGWDWVKSAISGLASFAWSDKNADKWLTKDDFRNKIENSVNHANGAAQANLDTARLEDSNGKKVLTLNINGVNVKITGSNKQEVVKELREAIGGEIAETIVNQLQIYDEN